ncbi:MAG: peptidase U34 [Bacilli bacterium]|nr:peptidase U34 [Bacilli bacterium]
MCDTLVCLPSVTKHGRMIFAKNSDRSPNEPHIVERIPAQDHDLEQEPEVQATYIKVKQVPHTYAVTLFKPSWIWGAEMGFNEYGVNIGNEAVFTKVKRGKDALIGMDLIRLALERSKTAYEAMICITKLLAEYGQGGNCGYQKRFYYDNSYLIADGKEAYVLETAGKYWVAKEVKDYYAISNALTIDNDFDYAHPEILVEKMNDPNFSFRKKFSEPVFTYFAKAKKRRTCSLDIIQAHLGEITIETIMNILRSHQVTDNKASVGSVCMHAGGPIGDHTTGSYIYEYREDTDICLFTGASLPCTSMYKLLLKDYVENEPTGLGIPYWAKRELLLRYFISGQGDKTSFTKERDVLEQELLYDINNTSSIDGLKSLVVLYGNKEEELIDKYYQPLKHTEHQFSMGSSYYRKYWTKMTKRLVDDLNSMNKGL